MPMYNSIAKGTLHDIYQQILEYLPESIWSKKFFLYWTVRELLVLCFHYTNAKLKMELLCNLDRYGNGWLFSKNSKNKNRFHLHSSCNYHNHHNRNNYCRNNMTEWNKNKNKQDSKNCYSHNYIQNHNYYRCSCCLHNLKMDNTKVSNNKLIRRNLICNCNHCNNY